ncbi:hypothetical protein Bca4012_062375 [Brassica carinata]|uniref:Uncharacterized protein n=1 Tax=Brassica carinata TaxID=52824 RepID=A0A8X7THJ8_BRACI|nr:hypothetical protein Bca52824_096190 [Brassica carinata]
MLLAVEGGGFFSTSSSGYSEGLTLLLSGDKHGDRLMRVLDFLKNRVSRGCASFSCFSCGGASAGLDTTTTTTTTTPCPLKVEPVKHPVVSSSPPPESVDVAVAEKGKDPDANKAADDNSSKEAFKLSLRSSLKRPPSVVEPRSLEGIKEDETLSVHDNGSDLTGGGDDMGRRKVQWPDACGSELTQVREFEPSEMGLSDEEWETGQHRTCSCVIM